MEHIEIEERSYLQNIQKTKEVIQKLKAMARHYEISFQEEDSRMDTILNNYHLFVEAGCQEEVDLLLKQASAKKEVLVLESLSRFFKKEEKGYQDQDSLLKKPEILEVFRDENFYTIKTKIGTIKVADAKEYYFKKGFVFPSWSEQGDSLDSTLDFVKEKKKYKAIVSYAPNPFSGFHTHAYAKKKGNLVDVGSNMIFFDHTGELLEKGEVIFEKKFADMNMQGLKETETPKLLQLALQAKKEKK